MDDIILPYPAIAPAPAYVIGRPDDPAPIYVGRDYDIARLLYNSLTTDLVGFHNLT